MSEDYGSSWFKASSSVTNFFWWALVLKPSLWFQISSINFIMSFKNSVTGSHESVFWLSISDPSVLKSFQLFSPLSTFDSLLYTFSHGFLYSFYSLPRGATGVDSALTVFIQKRETGGLITSSRNSKLCILNVIKIKQRYLFVFVIDAMRVTGRVGWLVISRRSCSWYIYPGGI